MCLFGFYRFASGDREKETEPSLFWEASTEKWCHVQRFIFTRVTLGSISFAPETISITETLPRGPDASSYLLSWAFIILDTVGDESSVGTLGFWICFYLL